MTEPGGPPVRHEHTLHAPGLPILLAAALMALSMVVGLGVARTPKAVQPA